MAPAPFPGWGWPVPVIGDRKPLVTSDFGPRDRNIYSCGHHLGVDILYRWRAGDPTGGPQAVTRVDKTRGRFGFVMFTGTPILAAGPGEVIAARLNSRGHGVYIDHGNTVITWYQHLSTLAVKKGDVVAAGQELGLVGWDLADAARSKTKTALLHLHFEWLFRSKTHPALTPCHNRGAKTLGYRAICLDPERYLVKLGYFDLATRRLIAEPHP